MSKNKLPSQPLEQLSALATSQALQGNWEIAIKINKEILQTEARDVDALNRLGHAYTETSRIPEAIAVYRKVLRINPYNTIAGKNLKRFKALKGKLKKVRPNSTVPALASENLFLEEPGKTTTVTLTSQAEPKVLAMINCADPIVIVPKKHQISITDVNKVYLGKLPDDLAARLIRLIKGGNRYEGFVKSVGEDHIRVFLREIKRSKRFKSVHSFPIEDKSSYVAFTPPDMVHGTPPEARTLEDQDEPEPAEEEPEEGRREE